MIEDVPNPTPGPRELLIRVKATSFCHSDLSIVTGEWGDSFYPQIIGHEAVGVVEEVGPEAAAWGLEVGDFVGAPLWHAMCLKCADCKGAGPQFCPTMKIKGMDCAGYLAEYSVMDAASAVKIPQTVTDSYGRELAPVSLSIALDVRDEQLQAVKDVGLADGTMNVNKYDATGLVEEFRALNDRNLADVVVVTSGVIMAYQVAFSSTRSLGRLLVVSIHLRN